MLINRAIERARQLRLESWLLRRRAGATRRAEEQGPSRAAAGRERAPVVLVPPLLGTRLVDSRGRTLWGATSRLFFGPPVITASDARPAGLLEQLPVLPGLYAQDIHGGLMRFLTEVGGYKRGEDLFVFEYDWRTGVADAAAKLADFIARLRGAGDERVDLLCVSSGGAIARYFMAYGGADVTPTLAEAPTYAGAACVRRVIYVGSPQRGTFGGLSHFHEGMVFVPGARRTPPSELARCQAGFDFLPHPDDPLFVNEEGRVLPFNLYDPDVWIKLGIADGLRGFDLKDFAARLDRGLRLHRALDRASVGHPDTIVIGGRHQPTPARVLVSRGRAIFPPCAPDPADPYVSYLYTPGDGALPEASMRAVPGLDEGRLWLTTPRAHHLIPADPGVHRLALEALLASDRPSDRPIPAAATRVKSADSLVRSGER